MLGIKHHRSVKLTAQTGSVHIKFVAEAASLSAASIRAVLCLEPTMNTK